MRRGLYDNPLVPSPSRHALDRRPADVQRPPALAENWRRLLTNVRAQLADWLGARGDTLDLADPGDDLTAFWLHDDLLLLQTCGYPLLHALNDRVRVVAMPDFDAPGCTDGTYRSTLVVGAPVRAGDLADCRGLCAVYNGDDSNSRMNLLRHAVAPFARDDRFFASVERSGGHLASLKALADGRADVVAIDCVTSPSSTIDFRRWQPTCAKSVPLRARPACPSSRRCGWPRPISTPSPARSTKPRHATPTARGGCV